MRKEGDHTSGEGDRGSLAKQEGFATAPASSKLPVGSQEGIRPF